MQMLDDAIAADPDYALPYAYKSMLYTLEFNNNWMKVPDALDKAQEFAVIALQKDPDEPMAYNAAAVVGIYVDRLDEARANCERALELNPSFANTYGTLGNVLMFLGQPEEAVRNLERAMRLDPLFSYHFMHFIGLARILMGEYPEAVETLRERIRLAPGTDLSRAFLASALGHCGRADEARQVWAELRAMNPAYSAQTHFGRLPFRRPGDRERLFEGLALAGIAA
jgi:adenylate cyclase